MRTIYLLGKSSADRSTFDGHLIEVVEVPDDANVVIKEGFLTLWLDPREIGGYTRARRWPLERLIEYDEEGISATYVERPRTGGDR